MGNEAYARIIIDKLLGAAGWDITNLAQVSPEEAASDGRADYVLKDTQTRPVAVIEAKRFSVDPYTAKEQAKEYAISLPVPFIILSNGQEHYFWDYADGDARPILGMPSQAELERRKSLKIHRRGNLGESLLAVPYPSRFLFKGEEIEVRDYQLHCLKTADEAMIAGRRRMLFEMATGTGKTLTIAMLMKRWFQAALISRVLFLVDRIQLGIQAKETFDDYLRDWPSTILYGGKKSLEGQIVVGTLDTIAGQLGAGGFGHAYFDLVVTDECHRSIYNIHRATLGHFDAVHIGLTATPNPGELRWVSEHERQLVKSTYIFFDCWDAAKKEGKPTYSYPIHQAIDERYLCNYKVYKAESVLTFEGAEWEGDEIKPGRWGRDVESEDRLKTIIQEYYNADSERSLKRPRKTIVFAVSMRQAAILAKLFNRLLSDDDCLRIASQLHVSPAQIRQDYAKQITCYSNNGNPKPIIDQFKYDPLPVIAVSVDMLDTGYDHKEVENLVMLRPTNSAIKYAQMRGRGSRLCPKIGKEDFIIYDFVGNTDKFNDPAEQYHKPKVVGPRPGPFPPRGGEEGPEPKPPPEPPPVPPREFVTIAEGSLVDEIRKREILIVGPEGLAIDRVTYRDEWKKKVAELKKTDPAIEKIFSGQELTEQEWEDLALRLNSPIYYFDEESLRRAFEQPTGSLSDFIRTALGLFKFPTREERIQGAFHTWVAEHSDSIKPHQAQMLRLLEARVLVGEQIEMLMFNRPPFSLWGGLSRMEKLFGREKLQMMIEELNSLLAA
jgi:type I restriction enzyme R subunit